MPHVVKLIPFVRDISRDAPVHVLVVSKFFEEKGEMLEVRTCIVFGRNPQWGWRSRVGRCLRCRATIRYAEVMLRRWRVLQHPAAPIAASRLFSLASHGVAPSPRARHDVREGMWLASGGRNPARRRPGQPDWISGRCAAGHRKRMSCFHARALPCSRHRRVAPG